MAYPLHSTAGVDKRLNFEDVFNSGVRWLDPDADDQEERTQYKKNDHQGEDKFYPGF
jgi:hypothetical protein